MEMISVIPLISNSSSIALLIHISPDGDAVGSSIALMHALEGMGKRVDIYCQDQAPRVFNFLDGIHRIRKPGDIQKKYDLAISLDCSDRERMGTCSAIMDKADNSANIDHHLSNTMYADINIVDDKASATGEMVVELISLLINTIDKKIAQALYTAIVSDTGGFSFSNTTAKTHRAVALLIEAGVDVNDISTRLFKNHSIEWIRLLGETINSLEIHHNGKVAVMNITRQMLSNTGADEEQTSGIIQYAKDIYGVELAIVLREIDNSTTKASLRSQSLIDVSQLALKFGGGGHKRASGCTINMPIAKAEQSLMNVVGLYFEE